MTDRIGRSYGEAEVEFATKAAALDCIAKLDNEVADGKYETFYYGCCEFAHIV